MWDHLYKESIKMIQMKNYLQNRETHRHKKLIYSYQNGEQEVYGED